MNPEMDWWYERGAMLLMPGVAVPRRDAPITIASHQGSSMKRLLLFACIAGGSRADPGPAQSAPGVLLTSTAGSRAASPGAPTAITTTPTTGPLRPWPSPSSRRAGPGIVWFTSTTTASCPRPIRNGRRPTPRACSVPRSATATIGRCSMTAGKTSKARWRASPGRSNDSSPENPLYLIVAGPMEVPLRGIEKADPARRKSVYCISHSRWNDGYSPKYTLHPYEAARDRLGRPLGTDPGPESAAECESLRAGGQDPSNGGPITGCGIRETPRSASSGNGCRYRRDPTPPMPAWPTS